EGMGTLWSLFRAQNAIHRNMVGLVARGVSPLDRLPNPFETVIPNATKLAQAGDIEHRPTTFRQKYGEFARVFEALCEEIVHRAECRPYPEDEAEEPPTTIEDLPTAEWSVKKQKLSNNQAPV